MSKFQWGNPVMRDLQLLAHAEASVQQGNVLVHHQKWEITLVKPAMEMLAKVYYEDERGVPVCKPEVVQYSRDDTLAFLGAIDRAVLAPDADIRLQLLPRPVFYINDTLEFDGDLEFSSFGATLVDLVGVFRRHGEYATVVDWMSSSSTIAPTRWTMYYRPHGKVAPSTTRPAPVSSRFDPVEIPIPLDGGDQFTAPQLDPRQYNRAIVGASSGTFNDRMKDIIATVMNNPQEAPTADSSVAISSENSPYEMACAEIAHRARRQADEAMSDTLNDLRKQMEERAQNKAKTESQVDISSLETDDLFRNDSDESGELEIQPTAATPEATD